MNRQMNNLWLEGKFPFQFGLIVSIIKNFNLKKVMGCSHSKRIDRPEKKKVSSIGILMNYKEQRPTNPNNQIDSINRQITKSPFPYIKPDDKDYQPRTEKSYISSASQF